MYSLEPTLLQPTPLNELKKEKGFLKMLMKRDKDLDLLRKKNEKVSHQMRLRKISLLDVTIVVWVQFHQHYLAVSITLTI